jgi:lipopolysaccharide export system protein LptA
MLNKILFILFFTTILFGNTTENNATNTSTETNSTKIIANEFEYDEVKQYTHFKGDVKVYQNRDKLFAKSVYVTFDKDKNPTKYLLEGNVSFNIFTETKNYIGKGEKIELDPIKEKVTILKNGYLEDVTTGQKIRGEKIYLDKKSGFSSVFGAKNKPVTFIINQNKNK